MDVEEAAARDRDCPRGRQGARRWESAREHVRGGARAARARASCPATQATGWTRGGASSRSSSSRRSSGWRAAALALGGPELVAAERASRELIARSPYRETGYRFLMEALAARRQRRRGAARVRASCACCCATSSGAAPAAELQALHQRLLGGEARPARPPAAAPPRTRASVRVPLPSVLSPRERSAFVGRERELERAAGGVAARPRAGSRRLVLVAGEPGIGKTRLTSELAREAHDRRHRALRRLPGGGAGLLPAVRRGAAPVRARAPASTGRSIALGPGGGELARLVPELAAALPATSRRRGRATRRRAAICCSRPSRRSSSEASARAPLLLVLDDLHWADRATLRLLRHVVRAPQEASLLIVGTYRDAEVGARAPARRAARRPAPRAAVRAGLARRAGRAAASAS